MPYNQLYMLYMMKHDHSVGRADHVAWTPPSLPNSIVLLGGYGGTNAGRHAEYTAEIVPGFKTITRESKLCKFLIIYTRGKSWWNILYVFVFVLAILGMSRL